MGERKKNLQPELTALKPSSFVSLSPFVNVVSLIDSTEILNTYIVPGTVPGTNKLLMLT